MNFHCPEAANRHLQLPTRIRRSPPRSRDDRLAICCCHPTVAATNNRSYAGRARESDHTTFSGEYGGRSVTPGRRAVAADCGTAAAFRSEPLLGADHGTLWPPLTSNCLTTSSLNSAFSPGTTAAARLAVATAAPAATRSSHMKPDGNATTTSRAPEGFAMGVQKSVSLLHEDHPEPQRSATGRC